MTSHKISDEKSVIDPLRRRLVRLGLVAPVMSLWACDESLKEEQQSDTNFLAPKKTYCSHIPSGDVGTNYRTDAPMRNDIRENKTGMFLHLNFKVVDVNKKCFPVAYADVEVWQSDSGGRYSDVDVLTGLPTDGKQFFRGKQNTTPFGKAQFLTLIPGWSLEVINGKLRPRISHINVRIKVDNKTVLTTECYFPDDVIEHVYGLEPYKKIQQKIISQKNGKRQKYQRPLGMASDPVWQKNSSDNTILKMALIPQGYQADLVLGVSL